MSVSFPTAIKNSRADAVTALVDAGTANPNGKLRLKDSSSNILSEHDLSNPSFAAAINGSSTANAISSENGLLTGQAVTFDIIDRDENLVLSGSVGAVGSGADLESSTSSTQVTAGQNVDITGLIYLEVS